MKLFFSMKRDYEDVLGYGEMCGVCGYAFYKLKSREYKPAPGLSV